MGSLYIVLTSDIEKRIIGISSKLCTRRYITKQRLEELSADLEAEAGTHKWEEGNGSNEQSAAMLLEPSTSLATLLLRSEEPVQHIEAGKKFLASLNEFLSEPKNENAIAQMNSSGGRTVDANIVRIIQTLAKL